MSFDVTKDPESINKNLTHNFKEDQSTESSHESQEKISSISSSKLEDTKGQADDTISTNRKFEVIDTLDTYEKIKDIDKKISGITIDKNESLELDKNEFLELDKNEFLELIKFEFIDIKDIESMIQDIDSKIDENISNKVFYENTKAEENESVGVSNNIPITDEEHLAIMDAIEKGDVDVIKTIVNKISDPVKKEMEIVQIIMTAIDLGKKNVVEGFVGNIFNFVFEKFLVLHAIANGQKEILDFLINNKTNFLGESVLTSAVIFGEMEFAKLLIEQGADVDQVNKIGNSPLIIAALTNRIDFIKMLIDKGANLNGQDSHGNTAYMIAAMKRVPESRKLLADELKKAGLYETQKLMLQMKLVAHAIHKKGTPTLSGMKPLDLESGFAPYWFAKWQKMGIKFAGEHPEMVTTGELKQFENLMRSGMDVSASSQDLLRQIKNGDPVIINTGFQQHAVCMLVQHAVCMLVWGTKIFVCNRGDKMRKPVEVFEFNPEKLTTAIIDELKASTHAKNGEQYVDYIFNTLPTTLDFKQDEFEVKFEDAAKGLEPQRVGNCSWVSSDTAIWAYFMQREFNSLGGTENINELTNEQFNSVIEEATKKFNAWGAYVNVFSTERLVERGSENYQKKLRGGVLSIAIIAISYVSKQINDQNMDNEYREKMKQSVQALKDKRSKIP